jgi:hypothetical protein
MAEWRVRVFGPKHQIEVAVECIFGSGWNIERSGDQWYMKTADKRWLGNGSAIVGEAKHEIERINLVYTLYNPNDSALLELGPHSFVREDGTRGHFLLVATRVHAEIGPRATQNSDGKNVPLFLRHPAVASGVPYAVARRRLSDDPSLQAVTASFLSQPKDWTRITKVIELIEARCNGQIPRTWVSRARRRLLQQTANSFAEAGGTGRHARPDYLAATQPMTLEEGSR